MNSAPRMVVQNARNSPLNGIAIVYSADGNTLFSADYDGALWAWDAATGSNVRSVKTEMRVSGFTRRAADSLLATAFGEGTIGLWNGLTGEFIDELERQPIVSQSMAFSTDGNVLAAGCNSGKITLWDVGTRKTLASLKGHDGAVLTVAYSPDGKTLASGARDNTIRLWDTTSVKETTVLRGHKDSGKSTWIAGVGWSPINTGTVLSVVFSPDGTTLASGSDDKTIKLWDLSSKAVKWTSNAHADSVNSITFNTSGSLLASGGTDGMIKIWDVGSGRLKSSVRNVGEFGNVSVVSVAFSPDGRTLASMDKDGSIKLWDVPSQLWPGK